MPRYILDEEVIDPMMGKMLRTVIKNGRLYYFASVLSKHGGDPVEHLVSKDWVLRNHKHIENIGVSDDGKIYSICSIEDLNCLDNEIKVCLEHLKRYIKELNGLIADFEKYDNEAKMKKPLAELKAYKAKNTIDSIQKKFGKNEFAFQSGMSYEELCAVLERLEDLYAQKYCNIYTNVSGVSQPTINHIL